jgi:hypothetical protein
VLSGDDCPDALGVVPAGATVVGVADVGALLADDALRARLNDFLAAAGETAETVPTAVESVLNAATDAAGLDPRSLSSLVAFGSFDADGPTGLVARGDWTTADVRTALEAGGTRVESRTYGGESILLGEGVAVGVPADGTFAVGDRSTVERVIDAVADEAPRFEGHLREAFEATSPGAIRVAAVAPDDLGEGTAGDDPAVDPAAVRSITHAYGAYVIDGDERRASITIETDDADAADTLGSDLEAARAEVVSSLEERPTARPIVDEFATELESVAVAADGTAVVVEADDGTVLVTLPLALYSAFLVGFGSRPSPDPTPAVAFEFESDPEAGTLTITHVGGDTVRARALAIRGEGLATGTWAELGGEADGEVGGDPAVVAGDAVSLDADPAYVARVVWVDVADGGNQTAILAEDRRNPA